MLAILARAWRLCAFCSAVAIILTALAPARALAEDYPLEPVVLGQYELGTPHKAHLFVNPTLYETVNVGGDTVQPKGWPLPENLLVITGDIRYFFLDNTGILFERIAHTGVAGQTFKGSTPNFGGQGLDYEYRLALQQNLSPNSNVRAGYLYRYRICCPGAGDPNNLTPRAEHGPYVEFNDRFGRVSPLIGRPFRFLFRAIAVGHRTNATIVGDQGSKPVFRSNLYYSFPVWGQGRLVPYFGIEWFSDYFDFQPAMSVTQRKVYGFDLRGTRLVSYRWYYKNDQVIAQGGNASHKATLNLEANFHLSY